MEIGALEYVVLGFEDRKFTSEVLPELNTIQESGLIRAVDLVFVGKESDGTVAVQEVSEFSKDDLAAYESLADDLTGLLTAEDIEHLAKQIPPGASAVIVLFEHIWTLRVADAVRRAGSVFFAGGMVAPDASVKVSAELAAAKEEYHA